MTERPPMWQPITTAPDEQDVLVFDNGKQCVARRDPEIWDANDQPIWIVGYGAEYRPNPTHWMPLPEPPL